MVHKIRRESQLFRQYYVLTYILVKTFKKCNLKLKEQRNLVVKKPE